MWDIDIKNFTVSHLDRNACILNFAVTKMRQRKQRAPEDVMLARLCSYVVKGRLWHTAGYLSAPKTGRDSQVGREKWSSSFGLYLTHLPSSFDIEEDVVTNVPGAGDAP